MKGIGRNDLCRVCHQKKCYINLYLSILVFRSGSSSRSRSRSPDDVGKVKFITSFGAESEEEGGAATMQGPTPPPAANASAKSESSTSHTDSKSDSNRHQSWSVLSFHCSPLQPTRSAMLLASTSL